MKVSLISFKMAMQKHMPLIAMIFTQFVYAAMFLLNKAVISSGMKPSVFIAYRQAMATLALAPFAYFSERKKSYPPTFYLLFKIFIVSSFGMALSLNLHYVSLKYISATFATALTTTIPAIVYITAVCLRIESLAITQKQGFAKVLGSVLGLSGAMVFTFCKGPALYSGSKNEAPNLIAKSYTTEEWIKGCILLLGSNLAWAIWLIMQGPILKEYPAKLRLTALQCGFSCLATAMYGAAVERNISSWKLGWDVNLLSVAYCGIVVTGITYTMQIWVVEMRGPVFTAIFSPLALILTAIFSALLFHETFYWGSALGCVLLVAGLYAFLWGKNKEVQSGAQQKSDLSKEEAHLESIVTSKSPDVEQEKDTQKI